jgi:UDP-glucose 4-epimerase
MRVFISGVAGQVGSHVADALLARGDQVCGIDNFATGRRVNLPDSPQFDFHEGSIADRSHISELVSSFRPDAVVHAAASYKDPSNWAEDVATNTAGAVNLIDAFRAAGGGEGRFIYYQTALVYGVRPLTNPITLDHPRRVNNSSYSISKGAAEDYLDLSGLDTVTFRLANVIGDRCASGPLPIFYQRLKDGKMCFVTKSRRDFVYVGDLVKATLMALDGTGAGAYHYSSGGDFPIIDLYTAVARAIGMDPIPAVDVRDLGPDDAPSILLDPSRTVQDFGSIDFTPLEETVRRAVAYYEQFGTAGEFTHLKLDS